MTDTILCFTCRTLPAGNDQAGKHSAYCLICQPAPRGPVPDQPGQPSEPDQPVLVPEISAAAEASRAARLVLVAAGLAEPQSLTKHAVLHGAAVGDCADCDLVRATSPHLFLPDAQPTGDDRSLAGWAKVIEQSGKQSRQPATGKAGRKVKAARRPASAPEMSADEAAALVLAAAGL